MFIASNSQGDANEVQQQQQIHQKNVDSLATNLSLNADVNLMTLNSQIQSMGLSTPHHQQHNNPSIPFNLSDTPYVPVNAIQTPHIIPVINNNNNASTITHNFNQQQQQLTEMQFRLMKMEQQISHQNQQLQAQAALIIQQQQTQQKLMLELANATSTLHSVQGVNHVIAATSAAAVQQLKAQGQQPATVIPFHTISPNPVVTSQYPISIPAPPLPLTVQDRNWVTPSYNGVNASYPGLSQINSTPPVFLVQDFLTPSECDFLISAASNSFTPAPIVGPGSGELSSSRTSSTCYLCREDLPLLMKKIYFLTGKPPEHCELPQVGRYLKDQKYLQHFDAFDLSNEDGRRFASNGGQRVVTVLVYLNDVNEGGHTSFPNLNLSIKPRQGNALVFFPSTVDGYLDKMALHAAKPAVDTKFVSQIWIRQGVYNGQPTKRLDRIMDETVNHVTSTGT